MCRQKMKSGEGGRLTEAQTELGYEEGKAKFLSTKSLILRKSLNFTNSPKLPSNFCFQSLY